MKTNLSLLAILACLPLASGCATSMVSKTTTATSTNVTYRVKTLLSNSAYKNLNLDGTTKTTSSLLRISSATTEPNPEAITATGDVIGQIIGTAVAAGVKGAK